MNFTGWENHVNGIYSTTDDVTFQGNTHDPDEGHHDGEYNQTIILKIYDSNNATVVNVTLKTNVSGLATYDINKLKRETTLSLLTTLMTHTTHTSTLQASLKVKTVESRLT